MPPPGAGAPGLASGSGRSPWPWEGAWQLPEGPGLPPRSPSLRLWTNRRETAVRRFSSNSQAIVHPMTFHLKSFNSGTEPFACKARAIKEAASTEPASWFISPTTVSIRPKSATLTLGPLASAPVYSPASLSLQSSEKTKTPSCRHGPYRGALRLSEEALHEFGSAPCPANSPQLSLPTYPGASQITMQTFLCARSCSSP